ncbi:hypothetical protein BKA93DRAFT_775044 [Sparassis latifolia]
MPTIAEDLLGALLIEVSLAAVLYGITTTQSYFYYFACRDDDKLIRWAVLFIWIVETVHTALCVHMMYHYLISNYGSLETANRIVWSAGATVITEVSISATVQTFFVRRIWILSHKSRLITSLPAVLLFIRIAFGYASAALTWKHASWTAFRYNRGSFITVTCSLSLATAVDFTIAVILIYYLQNSRSGFRGTHPTIRSLQAYIINSGAITMVISLTIVLTYVFLKNNLLYAGLLEMQGKLYANALLAMLNTRETGNRSTKASSADDGPNALELASRRPHAQIGSRHIEIFQHVTRDVDAVPPSEEAIKTIGDMDSATDEYSATNKSQTLI